MKKAETIGDFVEDAARQFEKAGLAFGHGTSSSTDEAAFLILETLGVSEMQWDEPLTASQKKAVEEIVCKRIETRKPSAYLHHKAFFQGLDLYIDERAIIPRSFIGEILCQENGFSRIGDYRKIKSAADICTGSGCLAILAADLFPNAKVDAVELSDPALEVAKRNVSESAFKGRISLFQGDLFSPLKGKTYDLIITNPPYVDAGAMNELPAEYRHEPAMALAGGDDGMDLVRRIIGQAADFLNPEGGIICEVGRGREILEAEYNLPFLWLDTEESEGEVFWLTRRQLAAK